MNQSSSSLLVSRPNIRNKDTEHPGDIEDYNRNILIEKNNYLQN